MTHRDRRRAVLITQRDELPTERSSPLARLLLGALAAYHWTASLRRPRCRFTPTCSEYAAGSIRLHGALRGGWLAVKRVARCHPWNAGGPDPVRPVR